MAGLIPATDVFSPCIAFKRWMHRIKPGITDEVGCTAMPNKKPRFQVYRKRGLLGFGY